MVWKKGITGWPGEKNGRAKLTLVEVTEIRQLHGEGWRLIDLAKRYDVTPAHISRIVKGTLWRQPHDGPKAPAQPHQDGAASHLDVGQLAPRRASRRQGG